ncbi:MAG: 50S ribosomal protein L13 [Candidatus Babeliales bacterium]
MDMNRAFLGRKVDNKPTWRVIDATDKVLGRLATEISDALRGKDTPEYTPHADMGDYVVVINAAKVKLTGKKWENKTYIRHSGYLGGLKETTAEEMQSRHPDFVIMHAVKGMLPRNKLNRQIIKKLKIYAGAEHPHQAQIV